MRIVSWNIARRANPWRLLIADALVDVALLQEASPPPTDVHCDVWPERQSNWCMAGYNQTFRTAIARLSPRVTLRGRRTTHLGSTDREALQVSQEGSITVADVQWEGESVTCISVHALWQNMLHDPPREKPTIFADGPAHRILSDLSALISGPKHKVLIAGDFNILRGYGEDGNEYWGRRYESVFTRMEALGFRFVGPEAPHGRGADPWPEELPRDSKNIPTFHSNRQTPATAARQLDFVFASEDIADRVRVRAMNRVEEWGPSDHCRVIVDVDTP
jgi:endonuclease/exonuclease/phosphatase family metal-dependent hydrolase